MPRRTGSEAIGPSITTSTSDLGYKTLGYLHYIIEKLNPRAVATDVDHIPRRLALGVLTDRAFDEWAHGAWPALADAEIVADLHAMGIAHGPGGKAIFPTLTVREHLRRGDSVLPSWVKDPQSWIPGTRMPSFFPETKPGEFMSPVAQALASPTYAAQKAQIRQYFASDAEIHIWGPPSTTQDLRARLSRWRFMLRRTR